MDEALRESLTILVGASLAESVLSVVGFRLAARLTEVAQVDPTPRGTYVNGAPQSTSDGVLAAAIMVREWCGVHDDDK